MSKQNGKDKSLPELIAERQLSIVAPILDVAYIRKMIPRLSFLDKKTIEEIDYEAPDLQIIKILANMVIDIGLASGIIKKEVPDEYIKLIGEPALEEIQEIYHAGIKSIGTPDSQKSEEYRDLPKEYKQRCLEYFERNRDNFQFIKREFLDNEALYGFSERQAKRDFRDRLLVMIIKDWSKCEYGGQKLFKIVST